MISNTPGPFRASEVSIDLIGIWEERSVIHYFYKTLHRGREYNTEVCFLYCPDPLIGSDMSFPSTSGTQCSAGQRQFKMLPTCFVSVKHSGCNNKIIGPLDCLNCIDLTKITV